MHANRGMYAEEIVNRTIDYYLNNNVCLIEKRNIPIKIVKIINDNMIVGKLLSKSTVDYCGFINNNHFEFEVKQTNNQNFTIDLIKQHQYEYLRRAYLLRSLSFLIVHFSWCDEFYLLPFK
jgi:recombination protein U